MQSNIYCDNELLRDLILDAKPSQGGLYPHELAMIFYTSIGQIQYENPGFAGVFQTRLKVYNPVCLLYSLVDRGYIRRSQFDENINFYGTREMQRFVKERGVKGSSKRDVLAEIIRSNFTESEIRSAFPQDYYVPTEKGQMELDVTQYTIMDAYKGWEENKGYYGPLKPSDIKLYCPAITELSISTVDEPWKYSLIIDRHPSNIGARIIRLPKRSNLIISKDGRKVYSVNDVDVIHFLRHHKVLVFENICDPEVSIEFRRRSKVIATVYDIENELPLYTEVIDYAVDQRDVLFSEFIKQNTKPFSKVIKHDGHIDYYVSVNDQVAYVFLKDYLGQRKKLVQISELNNYFRNDPTQNIKIAVLDSDNEIKSMIHHLISQRLLLPPAVLGIPFSAIAVYFSIKSKMEATRNKTRRLYYEDDLSYHINCDDLMTQIEAHDGGLSAFEAYFWQFPIQVYEVDMYRYYDSSNGHYNDRNWEFAKSHESALRRKYNDFLLEMRELGLIPTRWINELNLYFLIRSYFSDAIYQYRCDWLGLQSLDIYIPSKRVGIEYQGKQHYEAVEYFGGEQALENTRKRDARKRLLCRENRVQLLTWHYSVDVQSDTVYEFLVTSGIWKPEELKRHNS